MRERALRRGLLALNTFLLLGFYLLLGWTFLREKTPIEISLISAEEIAKTAVHHAGQQRRDEFLVIEQVFGLPRRPARPPRPQVRPTRPPRPAPPPRPRWHVRLLIYDETNPENSRVWFLRGGGSVQIVKVGEKIDGYLLEGIERQEKGERKGRLEVTYQVVLSGPNGEKQTIPFLTWEVPSGE